MVLSDIGKIVQACFMAIPRPYPNTRINVFQVMPNHVHGIIEILDIQNRVRKSCRGGVSPPLKGDETLHQQNIMLGNVVAYFKYQATKFINAASGSPGRKVFQRNYCDHIIRSDLDHFYIERYIDLNPLLWTLDSGNPVVHAIPIDELKQTLKDDHGLDEHAIAYLLDRESDYRSWHERG